jgi:hypothetical protein
MLGDLVNVRLVHGSRRIYIRLDLRELEPPQRMPSGFLDRSYYVFVALNRAKPGKPLTSGWTMGTGAGHRSGSTGLWRGSGGPDVRCDGLIGQFKYKRNEVRINIPRTCLHNPPWVRASIYLETHGPSNYAEDVWLLPRAPVYETAYSPRVWVP